MGDDLVVWTWGLRALAVVLALAVPAFLAAVTWFVLGPAVRETRAALRARDPWLPFLRREDGSWGPLVDRVQTSAARAEAPGSVLGLVPRYGVFVAGPVVLAAAAVLVSVEWVVGVLTTVWP